VPFPRIFMNFSSRNAWFDTVHSGCFVFLRFMCPWIVGDLRYSEVPLKRKNKTLVKILGGRQHRTTPAGQILGVATPATPAALTPVPIARPSCSTAASRGLMGYVPRDWAIDIVGGVASWLAEFVNERS